MSSSTDTTRDRFACLSWLARTALVVLAFSIVAAHTPARLKLIGLFTVALGGTMGATATFVARPHPARVPWWAWCAVSSLALCGLVGSTVLAFRLDASAQPKSSQQQLAATMMKQMERDSGGEIAPLQPASSVDEFRQYLARRLQQLGSWSSPWPELFWSVEVLTGSAAAVWGLRFGARHHHQTAVSEEIH